ncbi:hypothetical protein BH11ACT4_BH11ACT4_13840 [soil metagenome]
MKSIVAVLGMVAAAVIAWFLVSALFSLLWFTAKLIIVAFVAVLVYFGLRGLLARGRG